MRAYIAFVQKELMENIRTYKLLIMLSVFLIFGMLGPLTAKLMPKLLETLIIEGMQITIPEPTALDSWAQFFKNVSQMGMLVVAILFSGMMANEFSHGTLINVLTKGLARSTVILSKFTVSVLIWTVSYGLCFVVSLVYTAYFWGDDGIEHLFLAVTGLWIFGVLLLAVMLLGGVIFKNSSGTLLFTGGFIVALFMLDIVPQIRKYNPLALAAKNMSLLSGKIMPEDLTVAFAVSLAIVLFSIVCAIGIFNKKQL